MSSIKLTAVEQPSGGVGAISALLLPTLGNHFAQRAARLRQLAQGHAQADYLNFAAGIAQAQQGLLERFAVPAQTLQAHSARVGASTPLAAPTLPRCGYWQQALEQLIEGLRAEASAPVQAAMDSLMAKTREQRETAADLLLQGRYDQVDSGQAPFLWAALGLYFAQLAAALPAHAHAAVGEQRQFCPVCDSAPVASVILTGKRAGLRYLQCSLCESRWHMVRVKCSNCEGTGKLDYWSLDRQDSAVKAESCGDCDSYLKVFYYEHDPALEPVADDLASLLLDAELEREGFARSSISPFLFPG
ncbi:formate dehydrogenase accessory protein FdhE [compost metagenome]